MKKKSFRRFVLFINCFALSACILQAQPNIDSLLKVLKSSPSDTTKILTLARIGEAFRKSNPDTALFYLNEAIALAEKEKLNKAWTAALNSKGYILSSRYKFDDALILHQQALKISEETGNMAESARAYTGFGGIAQLKGDYSDMIFNYRMCLQFALKTGNKRAIAGSYTNIAAGFGFLSNYDSCLFYQLKAVEILEAMKEYQGLGKAYGNMGAILLGEENFSEALKYVKLGLENAQKGHDKMQETHLENVLSNVYIGLKNYDEAEKAVNESIRLAKENHSEIYEGRGYNTIGVIAEKKGDYKKAMGDYLRAYGIVEKLNSAADMIGINISMARVCDSTGKVVEALQYLKRAMAVPNFNESPGDQLNVYEELQNVYSKLGDYKNAYQYLQQYITLRDTLNGQDEMKMIGDLKVKYETEKKDQEIALLNLKNENKERQQKLFILITALLAVSIITLILVFRQRMQISKLKEAERSHRQLQLLRNDIAQDLHDDIGSTLSSISYYAEAIRKQVMDTTPQVIPLLDKMEKASGNTVNAMSDIVWAINATHDTGTNLVNRMNNYAIEMCGIKNIDLEFNADKFPEEKKMSMDVRKNLYLIFKEALNNALKYSGCKRIRIKLADEKDHITMKIEDDGNGFDTSKEFSGNGLKNIRLRAAEIKASVSISSEQGKGSSMILQL